MTRQRRIDFDFWAIFPSSLGSDHSTATGSLVLSWIYSCANSRCFESGTLGKYALYLEDGYMIHGTLYTRLLGRSVTHGCIRLGPEDLQAVWDAVPLGSSVYIF